MQIHAALVSTCCMLDNDCMLTTARAQTDRQRDTDRVGGKGGGELQTERGARERVATDRGGVKREGGDRQIKRQGRQRGRGKLNRIPCQIIVTFNPVENHIVLH